MCWCVGEIARSSATTTTLDLCVDLAVTVCAVKGGSQRCCGARCCGSCSAWRACHGLPLLPRLLLQLAPCSPPRPRLTRGWIITGEARKYNPAGAAFDGPTVSRPLDPRSGAWGAWEVVGRYSEMNLNYHAGAAGTAPAPDAVRGGDLKVLGAGVNWYWNPLVRFMFDYQHVKLDRLSPDAVLYQTAVGAQIGQTYDVVSVRSQFAF